MIQFYSPVGEMKYCLGESAPPTCLKGGMVAYANALSPHSSGKEGSGRQPQGGDSEQIAQALDPNVGGWWVPTATRVCDQLSHVVLSNQ